MSQRKKPHIKAKTVNTLLECVKRDIQDEFARSKRSGKRTNLYMAQQYLTLAQNRVAWAMRRGS